MTPEQISLIQHNFERVAPQAEAVATVFYNRLFAMQPVLQLLFPADLTAQKKKLMTTLGLAIKTLDEPERLLPVLEDLGRRHALAGVRDEHYETVGVALLETLRDALRGEFTAEAQLAWRQMYGHIAAVMKRAARELAQNPGTAGGEFAETMKLPRLENAECGRSARQERR
ncbi:MAG TPA: globin domain-containing protein [Pyrinomonadaceae bacterium]|jgi:hemoglobin-like flavoprotein